MSVKYMQGMDYIPQGASASQYANLLYADGWFGDLPSVYGDALRMVPGRFGLGTAWEIVDRPGGAYLTQAMGHVFSSGWIFGIAIKLPAVISNSSLALLDAVGNVPAFRVDFDGTGVLRISAAGNVFRTRAGAYRTNSWFFLQVKHITGLFEVKINGDIAVHATTGVAGPVPVDTINYQVAFASGRATFDDAYMVDPSDGIGSVDYLGNIRVGAQLPIANGSHIDLTPHGIGTNYLNANNYLIPDANYNFTPVVGEYDLYQMAASVAARDVFAINLKGLYYQDNGVQLFGKNKFLLPGGTIREGSPLGINQGGYGSINDYLDINPETGVRFTETELNGLEMGPSLYASD